MMLEALNSGFGSAFAPTIAKISGEHHETSSIARPASRSIRFTPRWDQLPRRACRWLPRITARRGRTDGLKRGCGGSGSGGAVGSKCEDLGSVLRRKKLAVFVSGGGSNFRSIHEATVNGLVYGDVAVLVTDKPGCGGAKYATDNGIPILLFPKFKSSSEGLPPTELVTVLKNMEVDYVLLAGYLKLIPTELVQAFPRSILNIHPSLLPAFGGKGFYGLKVHQAVIASGARYSGPTIHFVDEHYDTGRILAQRAVRVLADDNAEQLAARVLIEEHKLYVDVVAALCEERITWREDGVPLIQSKEYPNEYI